MGSIERELNEYLFLEFGMEEEEEALISESWPFSLRRLGEIGDKLIFEFDDDDEPFFAIGEPYLGLRPKNGMTIDDLALYFVGSDWIAAQDPVSLAESRSADAVLSPQSVRNVASNEVIKTSPYGCAPTRYRGWY